MSPKLIMITPHLLGDYHEHQTPYFRPIPFTLIRLGV